MSLTEATSVTTDASGGTVAAGPADSRTEHRFDLSARAAALALAGLVLAFVIVIAGDLNAPFGDSYEGRNGGTWGAGAESIRENGLIDSGLGARHDTGLVYARHPPLIYPVTAAAEVLGGDRPAATRAPSVLAAIATMVLLYGLFRTMDLRRISSLVGVGIASSTAMLTVYGPMPDTPMLGLPIGIAVITTWLRRRQGRPLDRRLEFMLAMAAALTAWQAVFIVLVLGAVDALGAAPVSDGLRLRTRIERIAPLVLGTVAGLGLTMLWVVWATGGPSQVVEALSERSGADGGVDWPEILDRQLAAVLDLFGVAVLGIVALIIGIRQNMHRRVGLLLIIAVLGYTAITPTAAAVHDYWLYWAVAPIAMGWVISTEAVLDRSASRPDNFAPLAVVAVAGVVMLIGWSTPSSAGRAIDAGTAAGRLVTEVDLPESQSDLRTIGVINHLATWVTLETGTDTGGLDDLAELQGLAVDRPDDLVLVTTWCRTPGDLCTAITGGGGSRTDHGYLLLTAAEAAQRAATP